MTRTHASPLRGLQYIWQRYVLRRRILLARSRYYDLRLQVHSADVGGRHLFKRGSHEEAFIQFVLQEVRVRDGGVILDVGANIGWYSLLLSKRFPTARILALEPEPVNHGLLVANLARNGCANVQAFELAASDRGGEEPLYLYPQKNQGRHSLLRLHDFGSITIRSVRLDDFLAEQRVDPATVDFVKIDIEGYEYHALSGAPRLLAARPVILSEYSPKYLTRGGVEPMRYLRLLGDAGFRPSMWRDGRLHPCDVQQLAAQQQSVNLVWQKPDR